jgi:hypothetical protein
MSTRCCEVTVNGAGRERAGTRTMDGDRRLPKFARRCSEIAGWIVPSATLALLPKCPVCVATYAVIGTGVGLSVSTVTFLRTLLVILCVLLLTYLVAKRGWHFIVLIFETRRKTVKQTIDRALNRCERQI